MEVLDTTIANVALRYIAGSLGVSQDEVLLGGDDLSRLQRHHRHRDQLSRQAARPQKLLPGLPGSVHRQLGGLRLRLEASSRCCCSALLQGFAGGGMVPVAQSILADAFPPRKARPGLRAVRPRRGRRARRRADAGRLAVRQPVLALVLPDQRARRPAVDGADLRAGEEGGAGGKQRRASTWWASCSSPPSSAPSKWCWIAARSTTGSDRASS